ncbi:MAG: cation-translocating P-type ATPase [Usitatibacter sp.]
MPLDHPRLAMGLTVAEAALRLAADGPNALPASQRRGTLALAAGVLREPMFLLLVGASAIYLVLGDVAEALVLAASIGVIFTITVVQERRTERTLEALRDLSSPRALVIRDGREMRIAGPDVVRGDLMMMREGDRVAADARIVEAHDLLVDESLLTGESVPVEKRDGTAADAVFSGTLVVRGFGLAEVTHTGVRSELGRIGTTLASVESGKTSLERETARMVRYIAAIGLGVCVLVALGYIATRGGILAGILAGLTLAMAVLPEEFPVVLTVFLALGAWRIAKHGVLTRRLPAVEMLGAATVLCCDKTGTLTENRMSVAEVWVGGAWREEMGWDERQQPVLAAAALACELQPFDPMERAILATGERWSPPLVHPPLDGAIERRYPLEPGFLAVAHGWRLASGEAELVMKGAPETVLGLCALSPTDRLAALEAAKQAARRGLRVLAVAHAGTDAAPWREDVRQYAWRFLGLLALADPIRRAVPAAIALCHRAGIRVVMITGDHPETAAAIARQAGIGTAHVVTGPQLAALDGAALAACVAECDVFARVRPEQKLRLVQALRAAGEIVAMTGDGVNDAPALKAAHIGIAMGKRGTDVAREAAALVLLDDDFTSIVGTVRLGRRIYDNIRNAMRYLIAVHVPLAGMALLPLAFGWPLFVFPVHVVFLEFVIDPACSIVFEAERSDARVMERPPRPVAQPLFTPGSLAIGCLLGASVLTVVACIYGWALSGGRDDTAARAMAFTALVTGNIALIFANRSHEFTIVEMAAHENVAAWLVVAGATAALLATIYVAPLASLFRFAPLELAPFAASAALGFVSVLWYDLLKVVRRRA